MINPSKKQNPLSSPVERQNPVNDPQFANSQGYSQFNMDHVVNQTLRYGEITPLEAFDTVSGDRHLFDVSNMTIANQLDAPLMSEVNIHTDVFAVPYLAMYPHNWSKILPNPLKGDDIPQSALPAFPLKWYMAAHFSFFSANNVVALYNVSGTSKPIDWSSYEKLDTGDNDAANYVLNMMARVFFILSKGQLLDNLGFSFDDRTVDEESLVVPILGPNPYNNYNNAFSAVASTFFNDLLTSSLIPYRLFDLNNQGSGLRTLDLRPSAATVIRRSYNRLEDLSAKRQWFYDAIQSGYYFEFLPGDVSSIALAIPKLEAYYNYLKEVFNVGVSAPTSIDDLPDLSKVLAYQMCVAEFYTADGIDDIFSSELYLQNLRAIMFPSFTNNVSSVPTFDWNGVSTEYDYFTLGAVSKAFSNPVALPSRLIQFDANVFVQQNALRYRDFFSSARTEPLAVGDVTIQVSDNSVSAVDVTTKLLMQRFLNAVNRVKNKLADYMTGIFGVRPTIETPAPLYITHFQQKLGSSFITNVAQDQGAVTTNINHTDSNQSSIDAYFDDSMVLLVLRYVEGVPAYNNSTNPCYFLHDRFERFNPMLQHIGDEPLDRRVITTGGVAESTFGYTARYSAYKFAISRNTGGFVDDLPGYVFSIPESYLSSFDEIQPDFIRERQFMFDQFFKSLTGVSPAQYFHFITSNTVRWNAVRKMEVLPPTLF